MYAVVEISGKQYHAEKGDVLMVDRLEAEKGVAISFDKVVFFSGDTVKVGSPYVAGAAVKAIVQEEIKGEKIIVFKYKPKKDYRRTHGHRQPYTLLKVEEILG